MSQLQVTEEEHSSIVEQSLQLSTRVEVVEQFFCEAPDLRTQRRTEVE
jgi:hypothetical protein